MRRLPPSKGLRRAQASADVKRAITKAIEQKGVVRTRYVNTFIFSDAVPAVLLIKKQRPEHQRGRLNGIGGKIERGESAHEAAVREIEEECGLKVRRDALVQFSRYITPNSHVTFFAMWIAHEEFVRAATKTDEDVLVVPCDSIQTLPIEGIMPNLRWQVPMALQSRTPGSRGYLQHFEIFDEERRA